MRCQKTAGIVPGSCSKSVFVTVVDHPTGIVASPHSSGEQPATTEFKIEVGVLLGHRDEVHSRLRSLSQHHDSSASLGSPSPTSVIE